MKLIKQNQNKNDTMEDVKFDIKEDKRKISYEFQQIGLELEPVYGKVIWALFYKYHIDKIKDAVKIARQRGKETYPYLVGIIKKLK